MKSGLRWTGAFDYELIYVDDGSTDQTFNILKTIRDEGFKRLTVIRHQQSVGQSFSVLNGARHGVGEWLVVLDADGQNDPKRIFRYAAGLTKRLCR